MTSARRAQLFSPETFVNSFSIVLHACGPNSERKSKLALYAFFIGQFEIDVMTITKDETTHSGHGEIHAA